MARDRKADDHLDFVMNNAEADEVVDRRRRVGCSGRRRSSGLTGWKKRLGACAARLGGDGHEDGGATGSRPSPQPTRRRYLERR
ncbi:hypothetical protein IscW_ISCW009564 [Ixodes scapularis]|uniref:Uncharacterized protein n=1 Tax=Ixodes scapularis TaxID=6945 RepID=B7Q132_IXOSC|nr:hypothetical protein IscW_ISCW009564 [Ixodes scapularis]|eukprot:XP_002408883.1 hypothetical protein IscW_ISCW009564 [Ixodes scapularis]